MTTVQQLKLPLISTEQLFKDAAFFEKHGFLSMYCSKEKEARFKELLEEMRFIASNVNHSTISDFVISEEELQQNYSKIVARIPTVKMHCGVKRNQIPWDLTPGSKHTVTAQFLGETVIYFEIVSVHDTEFATLLVVKLLETVNTFKLGPDAWIHTIFKISKDPTGQSGFMY